MNYDLYIENFSKKYLTFLPLLNYELYLKLANKTIPNFIEFSYKQKQLIECYDENSRVIVKKSRLTGDTTLTSMYLAIKLVTEPNTRICIVEMNGNIAEHQLRIIYEYINILNGKIIEHNRKSIKLFNGSLIKTTVYSHLNVDLRGYSFNIILFNDASRTYDLYEELSNAYKRIYEDNKIIISSIPSGNSTFKTIYEKDEHRFTPFEIGIMDNPSITDEILHKCKTMYHGRLYKQEILGEFI